jgi:Spy/CpxP family protein refolding chaperone
MEQYFKMKGLKGSFPLLVLLPQLLIGMVPSNTLAQQPPPNVRKEHLEYCVKQLTVQVGQIEAIKGVMQQETLNPVQKLESVGQILTPEQKEQLGQCLQQPMPPQQPPQQ